MTTRILLLCSVLLHIGIANAGPAGPAVTATQRRAAVPPSGDDVLRATPFRYTKKTKVAPSPAGTGGYFTEFKRLVIE